MPVFAYRGLSTEGRSVSGVIDADSARTAREKLRGSGIFPTNLAEEYGAAAAPLAAPRDWIPFRRTGMSAGDLALLTRQLGSLLGAGVQLVDALGALGDQSSKASTKKMLSTVRERVREGSSLADALRAHPHVFSDLYVGMVRAGEQAAALEAVLERLAEYNERQDEFVSKVKGALTYPMIMMVVGAAIMTFLVTYVVPQVATIFEQQHAALPLATQILIGISSFLTGYWIWIVIALLGITAGLFYGYSTPRGRRIFDGLSLRVPYIGPTVVRVVCARFARTLATLLAAGIQLLPALDAVKAVVTNGLLREAIEKSRDEIREGHGTLSQSKLFPPMLIEMIRVGERSGELERMLERVADNYEREVSHSLNQATTILEPVMTLMMAAVIVFMMLSVLMPIFQLNQIMQ